MRRWFIGGGLLAAVLLLVGLLVNHIEPGEAGLTWNPITGDLGIMDRPGWYVTSPLTLVASIDTRPQRVCLTSSAQAGINCRLVQFDATKYRDFLAVEGWRWYWWANRLSFNWGYPETYRGFRDVLRGYAFSARPYSFISTLEEQ